MGCFTFIKVMMILFNLAIFLGGGALLGVGIWVSVDSSSFLKLFGAVSVANQFVNVGYFLIAIGAVLVLLGFLGCCGAQRESKCLLIIFFSIILIIFIAEIAGAVVALVYSSLAESLLKPLLEPVLKDQYGNQKDVTTIWNATMYDLECCGFSDYGDFNNSYYFNHNNQTYPFQCCTNLTSQCNLNAASSSHVSGCFKKLLATIKQYADVVGGVAVGICVLELAAMVVSMYLYCHLDDKGGIH
ncbi:hypothetical protein FKM82_002024 [Ascaphus truei]